VREGEQCQGGALDGKAHKKQVSQDSGRGERPYEDGQEAGAGDAAARERKSASVAGGRRARRIGRWYSGRVDRTGDGPLPSGMRVCSMSGEPMSNAWVWFWCGGIAAPTITARPR